MAKLAVVILAAGEGTRMKSEIPKVLHTVAGRPMVRWVLSSVARLAPQSVCLIVGHRADKVREELKNEPVGFALQAQQLGSGHVLLQAKKHLKNFSGDILVLCADTPLITSATLKGLLKAHRQGGNDATVLTAEFENPFSYGRIVRSGSGQVERIVEEKDASDEIRAIHEINSGIYLFKSPLLWKIAKRIKANNKKKEYYLTDAIELLNRQGSRVGAYSGTTEEEILGINNRVDLAKAEEIIRQSVLDEIMLSGVTVMDPFSTYVSCDAVIGRDTVLYPGTIIEGRVRVGERCAIGPNSFIKESSIGSDTLVRSSYVQESSIGNNVRIGPFAHLRPGSVIRDGARVGNFSEVKKSVVGEGAKVNHLSYIGDAYLGRDVNVGAGTITCNYDGVNKNKTYIGDRAFVGSNVNFVAPVRVGADIVIGAGSTITDNVPAKSLAIARARQVTKPRKIKMTGRKA